MVSVSTTQTYVHSHALSKRWRWHRCHPPGDRFRSRSAARCLLAMTAPCTLRAGTRQCPSWRRASRAAACAACCSTCTALHPPASIQMRRTTTARTAGAPSSTVGCPGGAGGGGRRKVRARLTPLWKSAQLMCLQATGRSHLRHDTTCGRAKGVCGEHAFCLPVLIQAPYQVLACKESAELSSQAVREVHKQHLLMPERDCRRRDAPGHACAAADDSDSGGAGAADAAEQAVERRGSGSMSVVELMREGQELFIQVRRDGGLLLACVLPPALLLQGTQPQHAQAHRLRPFSSHASGVLSVVVHARLTAMRVATPGCTRSCMRLHGCSGRAGGARARRGGHGPERPQRPLLQGAAPARQPRQPCRVGSLALVGFCFVLFKMRASPCKSCASNVGSWRLGRRGHI